MPEDNNKNNNTNRDNRMFTNNYLDNQRKLDEEKKNDLNNSSSNNSEEVIGTVEVKTTTTYNVDATVKSTIETQVENQIKPDSFSGDKTISVKTSPVSSSDSSLNARPSSGSTQGSTGSVNGPSSSGAQGGNTMQNGASSPSDVNENVDNTPNQTNDLNKQSSQDVNQPENLDKQNDQNNSQSNNLDKHADQNVGKNEHTSGDNKSSENKNLDGTKPNSEKKDIQQDDNKQNKEDLNDKNADQQNDPKRPLNQNHNNNLNNQNNQDYNPNNNLRKNRDFNNRQKNPINNTTNPNNVPNAADSLNKANDLKKKSDAANKAKQAADAANKAKKAADTAKKAETAVKTAKTAKALASWKIWLIVGVVALILILFIALLSAISGSSNQYMGLDGYEYAGRSDFPTQIVIKEVDGIEYPYDIDSYVAAVLAYEVEFYTRDQYEHGEEALKAMAVAARTFAMYHVVSGERSVLPNSTDFQTNAPPADLCDGCRITMEEALAEGSPYVKAVNDTRGLVLLNVNTKNLINAEYDGFCAYDNPSKGTTGGIVGDNYELCQKNQLIPIEWMNNAAGSNHYNEYRRIGYHGRGLSQHGALYLAEKYNYTFEQILDYYYGDMITDPDVPGYNAGLYSIYMSPTYNNGNAVFDDYGQFTTQTGDNGIISRPLRDLYGTHMLTKINDKIFKNAIAAGPGTGSAVAAVATTLITEFDNMGVRLPYSWSGGHGGVYTAYNLAGNGFMGVNPTWGATINYNPDPNGDPPGENDHIPNRNYPNNGLDCSGFVTWAMNSAGVIMGVKSTGGFANEFSDLPKINVRNVTSAVAGDILLSNSHIMIVLEYRPDSEEFVVAEAASGDKGILIRIHKKSSMSTDYKLYSLSDYYANNKMENYEAEFKSKRMV